MSGGASLGTLLVQRLDAVLGHAAASHPHMISGVRRDAVTGPGAPQRTPVTDDSGRKPGPADEAGALVASALSRSRTTQAPARTLPLATPDRPHAPAAATESDESAEALDTDASQRRSPAAMPPRAQDARQTLGAGLAPRTALPLFVGSPSAPTVLGQTARVIHTLLADGALDGQALRGTQPLLTTADTRAPAQLAAQLRNMIELSGLFYERHLADLAFGRRDLRQLRAEPQARWSSAGEAKSPQASAASNTPAPGASPASPQAAATQGAPHTQPQSSAQAASAPPQQSATEPAVAAVSQDALTRMQLEALATQNIQWRGEAWDGAPLEWRIERDESPAADDDAQPWRTTLTLVLPRLGQVDIALSGVDDRLSVRMDAREAATELDAHKTGLAARLQSHGLAAEIAVKRTDTEILDDTLADARDAV